MFPGRSLGRLGGEVAMASMAFRMRMMCDASFQVISKCLLFLFISLHHPPVYVLTISLSEWTTIVAVFSNAGVSVSFGATGSFVWRMPLSHYHQISSPGTCMKNDEKWWKVMKNDKAKWKTANYKTAWKDQQKLVFINWKCKNEWMNEWMNSLVVRYT